MLNLKNKVVFKGDRTLWYVVIGLMLASLIVVYSSTGSLAFRVRGGNTSYYLIKQLFLMFGCMVVILTLQSFHYKYFLSFAKIVLGMSLIFLLWAKFAGTTLNDAGRWVTIPGIGFTFQPSEMAKLGIIMYCARAIAFEQTEECCSNNVLWRMTLVVPVLFLIFMENFSTSALLGVLYITEFNGETVQSLADLKGKTVYATGKGSTPEYFLRYLLAENGLDLDTDVTVEWKSEPSEVVALLKAENGGIAMLPQPYVTAAAAQLGEGFRAAVSLSEAWDALDNGSRCVTAGVVVRTEFAEAHPEAVEAFLAEMAESVDWVNADPADAGEICGALNIVKAPIAAKAIPNCNLVCLTGEEMISAATGTLETLFALNPSAVGGALPGEDFWFGA